MSNNLIEVFTRYQFTNLIIGLAMPCVTGIYAVLELPVIAVASYLSHANELGIAPRR
jgi:hypothetical protein